MHQIERSLSPAETAAFQQLMEAVSASEDRVVAASRKINETAQTMTLQMEAHVGQLMQTQERLQKTFVETTSQIKQIEQVSKAQEQAISGMMGVETSLLEESCVKIQEANRSIEKHTQFEEHHRSFAGTLSRANESIRNYAQRDWGFRWEDVEALLCAHHGPTLLYHLKKFGLEYEREVREKQIHVSATGELFVAYHKTKIGWLKDHFYPGKKSDKIPSLWTIKPVPEEDTFEVRRSRKERIFVHVPPLSFASINPLRASIPRSSQIVIRSAVEIPLSTLTERFEQLIKKPLKSSEPLADVDDLFEVPATRSLQRGDPLLQELEAVSNQLMAGVKKTKFTAEITLIDVKRQIDRLISGNRQFMMTLDQATVELDQAKFEASLQEKGYQKQMETFPAKMKQAQQCWLEAVKQADEKVEAAKQQDASVQFSFLLNAFFGGKLERAIATLDHLSDAIQKDKRFSDKGKQIAAADYKKRKEIWIKRLPS